MPQKTQKTFDLMNNPLLQLSQLDPFRDGEVELELFTYDRPGDGNHDLYTKTTPDDVVSVALKLLRDLPSTKEIGVKGRVEIDADINWGHMHIPMVDFEGGCPLYNASETCEALEKEFPGVKLTLYETGRSFHAYGNLLLGRDEWLRWMGQLLLVDPKDGFKTVDARWVGFSLVKGYTALRLTGNTALSLAWPTKIERSEVIPGMRTAPTKSYGETKRVYGAMPPRTEMVEPPVEPTKDMTLSAVLHPVKRIVSPY